VRLPDNYDPTKPYPLFFGFHWRGGTATNVDNGGSNGYWWSYYGMQRKSDDGAIFVAPQGINGGWSDPSDLTFVDDMISLIEKNYCVDTTRLVTMGFSWGSGMSYALSCARAKVFRAAVLYEGGVLSGCDGPATDPIAYMQIEGLTDTTLPISGAYPMRDKFVQNNGCTPLASSLDNPGTAAEPPNPPPYLDPGGHICTNYAGCSAEHPLRWCVSQSAHGPGPIDGTSDLYNSCATHPGCSASCPCTWTPDDVWSWFTTSEPTGTSFQTPNATQ
jgi:pimeloyl-ACP methyl ester carboxylesterase